jgi:hypothetical protein
MSEHEEVVDAIAMEIERYLAQHPDAADSVRGIQTWWLSPSLAVESQATVLAALEKLEARGVVVRTELKGVATTFSSALRGRRSMQ